MTRAVALVVLLSACSTTGTHPVGDACKNSKDCQKGLLCIDFTGGYCTADCSSTMCPAGAACQVVGAMALCLKSCTAATDCRTGYQCFQNVCQGACSGDGDCGQGFICTMGQCGPKPGSPVGADCTADGDCSSQLCLLGTCQQSCTHDQPCGDANTCLLDAVGDGQLKPTSHVVPICGTRRGTGAPGAACTSEADCDRGTCSLGMCVELCSVSSDCHGSGMSCADLVAEVDTGDTPPFRGCLPSHKLLTFTPNLSRFVVPSIAQSFSIYTEVRPFNFDNVVGLISLTDPTATQIYTQPMTTADFYNLAIRYEASESSSTMLVPNAPNRVTLMAGRYSFFADSSAVGVPVSTVYLKLNDPPSTTGAAPLNFYVTDLSGACQSLTLNQLKNGAIASAIDQMTRIYAQAGVTFSAITWNAVPAGTPNTIRVSDTSNPNAMMLPDLDNLLTQATGGGATSVGMDVVLLRSITDPQGGQSGVLGIAGGVPGSPILGTPHSGVAVSLDTLCFLGQSTFGATVSHEVGHSLGLFHNEEMTGEHDPLGDTGTDGRQNLMYWLEDSGSHLTMQQGQVIRNDAKVQP